MKSDKRKKYNKDEIIRLRRKGLPVRDIANIMGCSESIVWHYCKGLRITAAFTYSADPFQDTSDAQLMRIIQLTRQHIKDCIRRGRLNQNYYEPSIYQTLKDMIQAYKVLRMEARKRGLQF